jgi:hypothetical protein
MLLALVVGVLASVGWAKNPPPLRGTPPVWRPGDPAEHFRPAHPTPGAMAPADRDPRRVSGIMLPPTLPKNTKSAVSSSTDGSPLRTNTTGHHAITPLDVPSWLNSVYSWNVSPYGPDVEAANIATTLGGVHTTYLRARTGTEAGTTSLRAQRRL